MMQGASAGIGLGQQNANNPGVDYGGMSGLLQKLDPIGNKITEIGGDPLNFYGHKDNPNALLFPGANSNAVGQQMFPNLGPATMIPQAPGGAFQALHNGTGQFNNMASIGAGGQMFNPSIPVKTSPIKTSPQMGSKPVQSTIGNIGAARGKFIP